MQEKKIKVGIIGLGGRGVGLMEGVLLKLSDIEITAVCDLYEDRVENGAKMTFDACGKRPMVTTDYREVLKNPDVEAVIISSAWESHIKIAIDAMRAKKPVGVEVGGAYSIKQLWDLVDVYEETKTPIMMLENVCYGQAELMVLNMVKKGLFGEIVHCKGGYQHDLRNEVANGVENRHYRLCNYLNRNCENYPTHEIGPIARILDINYGNRMLTLNSVASKSVGLHEYIKNHKSDDEKLMNARVAQGDVVTTIIKCARGETITITLNTTLPRSYSRGLEINGTKGMYVADTNSIILDDGEEYWRVQRDTADKYKEKYEHPIWKKQLEEGLVGYHGGMDGLVLSAFFDSVRNGTPMPIDVYDMVSWMCISVLSEQSIAMGGAPVAIPDFTNGAWMAREYKAEGFYALK